ncbi:MAG: hypothetical protein DRP46_13455, partial [Candidatus Zixiibacteriota bacterium]
MKLRYPLLFILCLLFSTTAFGAVYTANETPGPGEFATIQDAVNMCAPTDSVEVIGYFAENVVVNTNGITIFGGGTIDGASVPVTNCLTINSNGVTVDGISIIYAYYDGIEINGTPTVVKNCHIHDNLSVAVADGVEVNTSGNTITDNCFYENDTHAEDNAGGNTWAGNSYDDFMANAGYPTAYRIYSSGMAWMGTDLSPVAAVVVPDGPTAILYGEQATFDLNYIADPSCGDYQAVKAVEFTVTWNTAKVDYVSYTDGDGMPGNGQHLIDESNTASGSLVVTATSLDDAMLGDGNLGHVTFDMIGAPGETFKIFTSCLAYTPDQDTIPMVPGASALATITDGGIPTLAYTVNDPFGDDYYNIPNPIVLSTIDVADDIDLDRAYWKIDGDW